MVAPSISEYLLEGYEGVIAPDRIFLVIAEMDVRGAQDSKDIRCAKLGYIQNSERMTLRNTGNGQRCRQGGYDEQLRTARPEARPHQVRLLLVRPPLASPGTPLADN